MNWEQKNEKIGRNASILEQKYARVVSRSVHDTVAKFALLAQ